VHVGGLAAAEPDSEVIALARILIVFQPRGFQRLVEIGGQEDSAKTGVHVPE
jgi:hypothetical protein